MKKQAYKTFSLATGRKPHDNGDKLAQDELVLSGSSSTMNLNSVHPIDTLLVHQLEDLLNGEKALRTRYASLDSAADDQETRVAFSAELSSLRDRTDRLYRLIDAMDLYGTYESHDRTSFAPAVA